MKPLRTAFAFADSPQAEVTVELPLPDIEGLLIIPRFVTFMSQWEAGDVMHCELSHYLNRVGHGGSAVSQIIDDTTWLSHSFMNEKTVRYNMLDSGVELAGPQAFCAYSDNASTRQFGVVMQYETMMVELIRWANIRRSTSYED